MSDKTKKLPRINHHLKTFGNCEEDYVVWGMTISAIWKRHGVKKPTLEKWRKDYKWDDQRELYILIRGKHIKILSNVAEKALEKNADPKILQLYKDLHKQFVDTDPNMKPIPNKERVVIVKMVLDFLSKKHITTVERFLSEPEYEELIEAVASY